MTCSRSLRGRGLKKPNEQNRHACLRDGGGRVGRNHHYGNVVSENDAAENRRGKRMLSRAKSPCLIYEPDATAAGIGTYLDT